MLYEYIYSVGHSICSTCRCPFPSSWLRTGHAKKQADKTFCSQGCMDRHAQDKVVSEKLPRPNPPSFIV